MSLLYDTPPTPDAGQAGPAGPGATGPATPPPAGLPGGPPPAMPPGPSVQPPVQPSRTEQLMAAQMHQMRQEIAQLTSVVMQMQTREVVHLDVTARRNDQNVVEGYTLIGRLA